MTMIKRKIRQPFDRQQINQLHQQFSEYGTNAKLWLRKCQLLLPEIARRQVWRRKGFSSIHEYAAKLAGMSRHSVDEALWILHKTEDKPYLQAAAGELGLSRVRPVIGIVTPATDQFWAQKARVMSRHALATYVHDYRLEFRPGPGSPSVKSTVVMQLDQAVAEQLKQLKGDRDWNELMQELVKLRGGAAGGSAAVAARPEVAERPAVMAPAHSRYIPAGVRRQALHKTGHLCAYPGCLRPYKTLHHTQRFALDRVHDPDRLAPLCDGHERIAHQGLIQGELRPTKDWRVREEAHPEDPLFDVDIKVMQYRAMAR